MIQGVWNKLGITHKTTSGYHPQTNGQVERMNHTLAMMISMYITPEQTNWDDPLPFICFAYNTARQESTGFSPFFLLYGREPTLPVDIFLGSEPNPVWAFDTVSQPYADKLMDELKKARAIVRTRLHLAQEKQTDRYNTTHKEVTFQRNDVVLVYKPIRKKGRSEKLLHRWMGPYLVIRQTNPVNYEVRLQSPGNKGSEIVHVGSMKHFIQSTSTTPSIASRDTTPVLDTHTEMDVSVSLENSSREPAQPQETPAGDLDRTSAIPVTTSATLPEMDQSETLEPQRSPGAKIVTQYHNNRGNITDLPPRRRRRPNFLFLRLPYYLLLLMVSSVPNTSAVIVRDTVLFNEQPGIAMSESSWKIVTKWTPKDELQTISSVELLITQLSDIAARHRRDATSFHAKDVSNAFRDTSSFMAAEKIETKVLFFPHYLT